MTTQKFIITILVICLIGALINNANSATPQQSNDATTRAYAVKGYRDIFIKSCNSEGKLFDYCSCTFDTAVKNVGINKFIDELSTAYGTTPYGETPDSLVDAMGICASKYN